VLSGDVATKLGGAPCKNASAEVSLNQPFVSSRIKTGQLHPLRLKGAPSR
jgi:hypothetical protein